MKYLFLACMLFSLNGLAETPIQFLGTFEDVQTNDEGDHCRGYGIDLWQKSDTDIFGLLHHHAGLCGDPACSVITGSNKNGYLTFSTKQPIYDNKYSFKGSIKNSKQLVGRLNDVDLSLKAEAVTAKTETLNKWCSFWEQVPRCQGVREYCASVFTKPNNVATPLKQAMVIVTEGQFFDPKYNNGVKKEIWAEHLGTDFSAIGGTKVYATKSGKIKEIIISDNPFNAAIIIESGNDSRQVYGHVKPAEDINKDSPPVRQGDLIGYVLNSDPKYEFSAHLHYGENAKGNVGTDKNPPKWGWGRAPYKTTCDKAVEAGWVDVVKLYGWGNAEGSKTINNCYTTSATNLGEDKVQGNAAGNKIDLQNPPKKYLDWGACPFECCVYREWVAKEPVKIYQGRNENSLVIATLNKEESVNALTGVVVTQKVGRAKVLMPISAWENSKSASPSEVTIKKEEIIYPLHYEGEGYSAFWYKGKVYSGELIDAKKVNIEQPYQYEWWAQIKNKNGKIGWTKQTNVFAQQDACG